MEKKTNDEALTQQTFAYIYCYSPPFGIVAFGQNIIVIITLNTVNFSSIVFNSLNRAPALSYLNN